MSLFNLWCKDHTEPCDTCNSKGDCVANNDKVICPATKELLKLMGEKMSGSIGPKMTKEEIKRDRKKRSTNDFKKNVFPTFAPNSTEHKHFSKKLKIKK